MFHLICQIYMGIIFHLICQIFIEAKNLHDLKFGKIHSWEFTHASIKTYPHVKKKKTWLKGWAAVFVMFVNVESLSIFFFVGRHGH